MVYLVGKYIQNNILKNNNKLKNIISVTLFNKLWNIATLKVADVDAPNRGNVLRCDVHLSYYGLT